MESGTDEIVLTDISRRGMMYVVGFSDGYDVRATKGVIDRLGLSAGLAFSPNGYAELKAVLERAYARYTAESILARRPYSIGEFKARLRQKEIAGGLIADIIRDFKEKNLLDDFRYAVGRAESLMVRKPAGAAYLKADLQKHLVPSPIAEKAVAEVLSGTDEVATAARLLERRWVSFMKFDLETARRKAYTYLSRRAISYGAAKEAFERLYKEMTE